MENPQLEDRHRIAITPVISDPSLLGQSKQPDNPSTDTKKTALYISAQFIAGVCLGSTVVLVLVLIWHYYHKKTIKPKLKVSKTIPTTNTIPTITNKPPIRPENEILSIPTPDSKSKQTKVEDHVEKIRQEREQQRETVDKLLNSKDKDDDDPISLSGHDNVPEHMTSFTQCIFIDERSIRCKKLANKIGGSCLDHPL